MKRTSLPPRTQTLTTRTYNSFEREAKEYVNQQLKIWHDQGLRGVVSPREYEMAVRAIVCATEELWIYSGGSIAE